MHPSTFNFWICVLIVAPVTVAASADIVWAMMRLLGRIVRDVHLHS